MPEIIKETFRDTSYKLAKALHFNKISLEYFEMLKLDSTGETKNMFGQCIQRLQWVYHNIYDRLSQNSRDVLKQEMSDSLAMDAIIDGLVLLQPEQRNMVEHIINTLNKGETIEVVQNNNY